MKPIRIVLVFVMSSLAVSLFALSLAADPLADDGTVSFSFDSEARVITVETRSELDRIDVHAVTNYGQVNQQLTADADGSYTWDLPVNLFPQDSLSVFFNYQIGGMGIDTETVEIDLSQIGEPFLALAVPWLLMFDIFTQRQYYIISSGGIPGIAIGPRAWDVDDEDIDVYVHYSVNGGQVVNAAMGPLAGTKNLIRWVPELEKDDVITVSFTIIKDGFAYDTAEFQKTYIFD